MERKISSLELYEKLKDKLGNQETKLLLEFIEEESKRKEAFQEIKGNIKRIEEKLNILENRIWWIVGLIVAQWLSVMIAILLKR